MSYPTFNGNPVRVYQVKRFDMSRKDVSHRFAGQVLTQDDIDYENEVKDKVLNTDTPVNVWYEIEIVD